jgi:hypothetical protein
MNHQNDLTNPTVRFNCNIKGSAAEALLDLKRRGIIQNNREAVVQALLALQEKIMKSDIEKNKLRTLSEQKIYLKPWDEVVGVLNGVESIDTQVTAFVTCTYQKHVAITIQKDSPETEELQQQLKELLGQKITILKTDNPQKPLVIRIFSEPSKSSETTSHTTKPQLRDNNISRDSGFAFYLVGVD